MWLVLAVKKISLGLEETLIVTDLDTMNNSFTAAPSFWSMSTMLLSATLCAVSTRSFSERFSFSLDESPALPREFLLSSQSRKWEDVRKFAPRRSPESLKACRGLTRLLHPLPRDSSSSPAAADSSLTRANPLGSSNETPNISSRIYLSLPLQMCSCKITKSDDRIWSGNSLTLRLYEPLQGPLW